MTKTFTFLVGQSCRSALKFRFLFIALACFASVHPASAQGTRFFRIFGPAATTITAFRSDGTIIWSNAQTSATYTVQCVSSLPGNTNWVDYVQLPATARVQTNLLVDFHPPSGMAFIPGGLFRMGDSLDGEKDAVTNNVAVSAFYMDTNLVSYSQWQSVYTWAKTNGYSFDYTGSGKAANHPVQAVDWYDSVKWCNARSRKAALTPVYYTDTNMTQAYTNGEVNSIYVNWAANGYRLPTEAEWEKAARGGLIGQRFPWSNVITEALANYAGDTALGYDLGPNGWNAVFTNGVTPNTSPVGYFAPNGYGLCDMAGNLEEWCWDWYGTPYAGGSDPSGPASSPFNARVARSGSWNDDASVSGCAARDFQNPMVGNSYIGFRTVMAHPFAPLIQSAIRSGASFALTWSATTSFMYQIQYSTNLAKTNWIAVGGIITATNSSMTISEPIGSNAQQFYRVVLLP